MKRIASLFLLVTLFYNVLGYYLMIAQKEEQTWVASMERKDNSKFKVIHLNASLYSFIDDTDFQYVNENVSINNKVYHVFKKRIQNNVLSLYYLPNLHQKEIGKSLNDIVDNQLFNNSSSKDSPLKKLMKYSLQDFVTQEVNSVSFSSKKTYKTIAFNTITKEAIHAGYHSLSYSPPDFV
ncbi:hypothetical protein [Flavobacterium granuli]|uniref:Uncharacterized protein n=1 Tax=Flavobacterium granuli TaxID=280093 RepID=A0ABU1S2H8_9FLAO|nr:hypothetical protein [Flavobacterium granuli]MDR6845216.1 hypothetical protein [Flavobacterium granuli]